MSFRLPSRLPFAATAAFAVVFTGTALVACSTNFTDEQANTTTTPTEIRIIDQSSEPVTSEPVSEREIQPAIVTQDRAAPSAAIEEVVMAGKAANTMSKRLALSSLHHQPHSPPMYQDMGRERYEVFADNGVFWAAQNPVSTFSIDVDSASYANMRRQLNGGHLPNPDSIRVEELVNYFSYDYPRTATKSQPFSIYTEMGPSPWDDKRKLVHIGVNGWDPESEGELPPANLVFLVDVSGSMQAPNKIYLLKNALKMMVKKMRPEDTISLAVYAGAAGEVLSPTSGAEKAKIYAAIDNLQAGGSTNGGAGIRLAYQLAEQNLKKDGINRVILATDGDFNVGTTSVDELERLAEQKRKTGVALTVLGFGTGNYNDQLMQKIAQAGNGNAAYIDNLNEARKVLVEEMGATLNIIAKDMKVQIEFNPAVVETYRLIGYETRHLNREDFNNDKVDAGDVGAGHTVTALYEVTLVGDESIADPLRYQGEKVQTDPEAQRSTGELAYLKLRYKEPNEDKSKLVTQPLLLSDIAQSVEATSQSYRFAGAVAWLGQVLRGNDQVSHTDMDTIADLATSAKGKDVHGYRSEFINLVRTAGALDLAVTVDQNLPNPG